MCAIAGIVRFHRDAPVGRGELEGMLATMKHRGPDGSGIFVDGNVGLAHRRLSIVDLAGGDQPMSNEDGSVVVVFNGEIYNHLDLRPGLEAKGHRFRTRSDTEVIVHGYEERGEACVDDLRGMFAFAAWDARTRRLLLARDRLGIKPLYYVLRPGFLAFASEIKALLALPGVRAEVDQTALELYLALRYVPAPLTAFRGISKLPPGHTLSWDASGVSIHRYWDVPTEELSSCDPEVAKRQLQEMLQESVRLWLMADVPLGVFLSGGLDSTTVLSLMDANRDGAPLKTFTVGYDATTPEEEEANEFSYARLAAESRGAHHQELRLGAADFQDALPEIVWHLDEPVADPACLPLFLLSRLASRDVTVVMSGEGADEILGGYGIYRRMLQLESLQRRLGPYLGGAASAVGSLLPDERLRHYARLGATPLEERYHGVSRGFLPELATRLLGRDEPDHLLSTVEAAFAPHVKAAAGASPLGRMLYLDIKTWLADDLLVKADKMTMASSQELRVPLLDHRLVELAARLPSSLKVRDGVGKALLRDAMTGIVPSPILDRPKKGFPVPTAPLLRRLPGFARDLLLEPGSACRGFFDAKVLSQVVSEHERGRVARGQEIWSLVVFELWHRVFVDGRMAQGRGSRPAERRAVLAEQAR